MTTDLRFGALLSWVATVLVSSISAAGCTPPDSTRTGEDAAEVDPAKLSATGNRALEKRDFQEAFEAFRQADEARPGTISAERWKAVGDGLADYNDIFESDVAAVSAYERALKADPKASGIRWREARLHVRAPAPRIKEALALLDEEDRLHPGGRDSYNVRKGIQDAEAAEQRRKAQGAEGATAAAVARARDRQEREQERAQQDARRTALRTQVGAIGPITCRLEGYRVFGHEFGNDLHSVVASGVFAGVLLQCVNNGRDSVYFPASAFAVVDSTGRRYSIDTSSSFELAIWNEDAEIQNPEALQLHPGSPRFVQLMFDLPPELASNESARLGFAKNQFRLIFPAEASGLPE
jgi:tetratricopeptide (TPR) repeat protein